MSRNMRIILLVGLLALAGGAAWYFLLGPGSGEAEVAADGGFDVGPVATVDCPPDGGGAGAAGAGAADPGVGAGADPGAGADGADGTVPAGSGDPGAAAPVARGGWGSGTVVADGGAGEGFASDSPSLVAQEMTDPAAGAAGTDPAAPGATDPAAGAGAGAADPAAGATAPGASDPAAAGTDVAEAVDPCADEAGAGAGTGAEGGAGAGAGMGVDGAAGGSSGVGGASMVVTEGANAGNNAEALAASKAVVQIGTKSKLALAVDTTLLPTAPGVRATGDTARRYRSKVTAAALRIQLADETARAEWTKGKNGVRRKFVRGFLTFLGKRYPNAVRSVVVLDPEGAVIAAGDAGSSGNGTVTLY